MLCLTAPAAFGEAATEGDHSPNMEFVKNLPYELRNGATGNDMKRGLDIYHFDGEGRKPKSRGRWMSVQEANVALAGRPAPGSAGTTYICLLDG